MLPTLTALAGCRFPLWLAQSSMARLHGDRLKEHKHHMCEPLAS